MYMCSNVYIRVYVYVYMYICIHITIYTYSNTCIYVRIYVCTCTHITHLVSQNLKSTVDSYSSFSTPHILSVCVKTAGMYIHIHMYGYHEMWALWCVCIGEGTCVCVFFCLRIRMYVKRAGPCILAIIVMTHAF